MPNGCRGMKRNYERTEGGQEQRSVIHSCRGVGPVRLKVDTGECRVHPRARLLSSQTQQNQIVGTGSQARVHQEARFKSPVTMGRCNTKRTIRRIYSLEGEKEQTGRCDLTIKSCLDTSLQGTGMARS